MAKVGTFGEIVGVEGKDYFVVETLENGNRVCVTAQVKPSAIDATVCYESVGSRYSTYANPCGKKAVETRQITRNVTTGGRYGHGVERFVIDANGFVVGLEMGKHGYPVKGFETLTETITVGYCGTHSPTRIAARQAKKDAEARAERERANRAYEAQQKAERVQRCRQINYDFVEKAAASVIGAFSEQAGLTPDQVRALETLSAQLNRLSDFIVADREHYGLSNYMIEPTGDLKAEYKLTRIEREKIARKEREERDARWAAEEAAKVTQQEVNND